jgi:osmoprotectant transport system substrate-binding protein
LNGETRSLRAVPAAILALVLALMLAACGNTGASSGSGPEEAGGGGGETASGGSEGGGSGDTIIVGSKNFTEQYVLGELYAQALEAGGFTVEKKLDLGSEQILDQALQDGDIDLYPEYTGTAVSAVLGYKGEPLETPEATLEEARRLYGERDPAATVLEPADFNNTYGIFVRKEVADEKGLKTLTDLEEASPELTFVSFGEFQERDDSFGLLKKNYPALEFEEIKIVNSIGSPIYNGVLQGEGDVGVGFTSDSQLADENLTVLEDPKSIYPFYYPAPVVRSDTLEQNPEIEDLLNKVNASLDLETMQALNAQVDIEREDPEDVARTHLEENGLLEQ